MSKLFATPLRVDPWFNAGERYPHIYDANNQWVAMVVNSLQFEHSAVEIAQEIVRRVNAYEDLLAVLAATRNSLELALAIVRPSHVGAAHVLEIALDRLKTLEPPNQPPSKTIPSNPLKDGPTPSELRWSCSGCRWHRPMLIQSGMHPLYNHYCFHDVWCKNNMGVICKNNMGTWIGNSDQTPAWCPVQAKHTAAGAPDCHDGMKS